MSDHKIIIYGTDWCGDCYRSRHFLSRHQIAYTWINIDRDKMGEEFVLHVNRGNRTVPTILFADGSVLTEPSDQILAKKLGIPDAR